MSKLWILLLSPLILPPLPHDTQPKGYKISTIIFLVTFLSLTLPSTFMNVYTNYIALKIKPRKWRSQGGRHSSSVAPPQCLYRSLITSSMNEEKRKTLTAVSNKIRFVSSIHPSINRIIAPWLKIRYTRYDVTGLLDVVIHFILNIIINNERLLKYPHYH